MKIKNDPFHNWFFVISDHYWTGLEWLKPSGAPSGSLGGQFWVIRVLNGQKFEISKLDQFWPWVAILFDLNILKFEKGVKAFTKLANHVDFSLPIILFFLSQPSTVKLYLKLSVAKEARHYWGAKEIYERLMIDFQVRLWFVQCLRSF